MLAEVLEAEVVGDAGHGVLAEQDGAVAGQGAHPGGDVDHRAAGAIAPARPGSAGVFTITNKGSCPAQPAAACAFSGAQT